MGKRFQIVQLYRSLRDSAKHKKLISKSDRQPSSDVLTEIESKEGQLLVESVKGKLINKKLLQSLEPQQHPAFCGLATTCVTLRGLGMEVTQEGIFNGLDTTGYPLIWFDYFGFGFADWFPHTMKISLNHLLKYDGLPLSAANALMRHYGLTVEMYKQPVSKEDLVQHLRESLLSESESVVVVNYSRPAVKQRGTGHFAPVAAFSPNYDSCLLLEVNSWRYSSVWVKLDVIIKAMNTTSPGGTRRGYMKISKCTSA